MNNEQYQQIIDEVYKSYRSKSNDLDLPENLYNTLIDDLNKDAMFPIDNPSRMLSQEEFINKCKTDDEFSKKWGLKIEEIELSLEERKELAKGKVVPLLGNKEDSYNEAGIPTKRINVTYRPKCKLEYLDLKITILPSGKTFEDYE